MGRSKARGAGIILVVFGRDERKKPVEKIIVQEEIRIEARWALKLPCFWWTRGALWRRGMQRVRSPGGNTVFP
jgi:hypothetical protein